MPEQFTAAGATSDRRPSHHGPAWVIGDRAYLAYGGGGLVLLDISDPAGPRLISRLDFGAAFSSRLALHTVVPLPERGITVVNTEAIAEMTAEPYNFAGIVDISDESVLRLISLLPVPFLTRPLVSQLQQAWRALRASQPAPPFRCMVGRE